MPERWGEYHTETSNGEEPLLPQSDFMLSSYPQSIDSSDTTTDPAVAWSVEDQLTHAR